METIFDSVDSRLINLLYEVALLCAAIITLLLLKPFLTKRWIITILVCYAMQSLAYTYNEFVGDDINYQIISLWYLCYEPLLKGLMLYSALMCAFTLYANRHTALAQKGLLTSAQGRLSRSQYGLLVGATFALNIKVMFLAYEYAIVSYYHYFNSYHIRLQYAVITTLLSLATIWLTAIFTIKRCHDLNKSGWFCLLCFVPVIGVLPSLYLLFVKGDDSANNYGESSLLAS
ncbi:DUF805 domain-containing protein [Reinekea thalattae]|uniref:DUF805 domain-containing protein n=1 Tax=Reinekea thalattae TaxID=2593301 RepID=A0A5C8Z7G5_9GAMM|nr:DUF805 domain-containing protein [Reinekea thalattae]TXR53892.1 DUF805 domain-containing protein [Reinekea thalattae]